RVAVVTDPQRATLGLVQGLKYRRQGDEPTTAGHVGWHELLAADWTTAFAFYSELFGWQRNVPKGISADSFQLLSADSATIGGMFTKLPTAPMPFWLYYFEVPDVGLASEKVKAGGGRIMQGPNELPGLGWIVWCVDPQGAMFALQAAANQGGV